MFIFDDSDHELMAKIAKGDKKAFHNLYNRYKTHVFGLAKRYLNQGALAEDIVQDVWMKVIDKSPEFKPEGSVKSWILMITRNMCLNELSKKSSQNEDDSKIDEVEQTPAQEYSEEYWIQKKAEDVKLALEKLPDRQRSALILQFYEDLSLQEIAKVLELEVNAVKALLFRARKALEIEIELIAKKKGAADEKNEGFIVSGKNLKKAR